MNGRLLIFMAGVAGCFHGYRAAYAQTTYEADFDNTFPTFGYSYDYSGRGDENYAAIDTSGETSSSYDVTTPPAATGTFDSSQWMLPGNETYTYAGWGLGIGFFMPEGQRPTSGDLSQYTLKFDAKVEGYDENVAAGGLETPLAVIFQRLPGGGDPTQEYRIGVNGQNLGMFSAVPRLTSTIQNFSIPLSDFANLNGDPPPANYYDFTALFAETAQVLFQLQPSTNAGEIGIDNNNIVTVDNVRVEGPFAAPPTVVGDYDANGLVEQNDYLTWRQEFGESGTGIAADGNGNGIVDAADYVVWRDAHSSVTPIPASAVPEPSTAVLLAASLLVLLIGRKHS